MIIEHKAGCVCVYRQPAIDRNVMRGLAMVAILPAALTMAMTTTVVYYPILLLWMVAAFLPPYPDPVCALAPLPLPSLSSSSRHHHHQSHRHPPVATTTTTTSTTLLHTTVSISGHDRLRKKRQSFFGDRQERRGPTATIILKSSTVDDGNHQDTNNNNHTNSNDSIMDDETATTVNKKDPFLLSMKELGWTEQQQNVILERLSRLGLYDDENTSAASAPGVATTTTAAAGTGGSHVLLTISQDLSPKDLSSMLMDDFQLEPLLAHQVRASTLRAIEMIQMMEQGQQKERSTSNERIGEKAWKKENKMDNKDSDDPSTNSFIELSDLVSPTSTISVNGHAGGGKDIQSISLQQQQQPQSQILMTPIPVTFDDNSPESTTSTTTIGASEAGAADPPGKQKRTSYKRSIVNQIAVTRKKKCKRLAEKNNAGSASSNSSSSASSSSSRDNGSGDSRNNIEYGLPRNYKTLYPTLGEEMTDFESFMTQPSTLSQEDPIRPATAVVYVRHAQQFLGWYLYIQQQQQQQQRNQKQKDIQQPQEINGDSKDPSEIQNEDSSLKDISIMTIFPSKEKESASTIIDFILWLRKERNISVSYEANLLRGLTKLLKFRFATESNADTYDLDKSYGDIPIIKELRKLHRTAERKRKGAPRSSDEERKWLSWPEYLETVQHCKKYTFDLMTQNNKKDGDADSDGYDISDIPTSQKVMIATAFQKYLVLAIFSHVPDRQRTIRELELGRSFVKLENGNWCIRHTPDDYKTGGVYGARPPMELSNQLSLDIDAFIDNWRSSLKPKTEFLFAQPKTGNPLTQDSVYQIVVRSCYNYTGKRTNPHLLRDMIVSHVRDTNASEKQLEALALYMGHSLHMQRSSYDRRTLTRKVAPAIELLNDVNNNNMS